MRKNLLALCILALTAVHSPGGNLTAYFSYALFNNPGSDPYVETYLSIAGNSVKFKKNASGKYQGEVEIGMLFLQGQTIKASKKYVLSSPEAADTTQLPGFTDQQRISLPNGDYDLEIFLADKNASSLKPVHIKQKVSVNFTADKVMLSNIQLIESFKKTEKENSLTKNGYDLVPYASDFYPESMKNLSFYAEAYNTKKLLGENEKFLFSYFIESDDTKAKLSEFLGFSRQVTNNVNMLLTQFPIGDLPSGNYNLVIEVRDKLNALVTDRRVFFQRKNPKVKLEVADVAAVTTANTFVEKIISRDTLAEYIRSLRPISAESEKDFAENQIKTADMQLMRQFFYNFWKSRNNLMPEQEWMNYNAQVKVAQKFFGTQIFKGYDTDRGRVFLQYGPPSTRQVEEKEPSSYPYEIWEYDRMKDRTNGVEQTYKKFVFYCRDLASNNYRLIHSTAIGEINDARWQIRLQKRMNDPYNLDTEKLPDNMYGNHADEDFNNPK